MDGGLMEFEINAWIKIHAEFCRWLYPYSFFDPCEFNFLWARTF